MMQDPERRLSAWKCSKTALNEEEAISLLQEFAEQRRKAREKDPEVKRVKNKYSLKAPTYPSPGNVLHTGKQLLRTPGPGILPLLPSQQFEPRRAEESFSLFAIKATDNMVPCGRQLERTPTRVNALREIQVNTKEGETFRSLNKSEQDGKSLIMCKASEGEMTRSKRHEESCVTTEVMADLENGVLTAQKELNEGTEACSQPLMQNRRISEMPVTGLNQMRISGVLKKLSGYECRNEDLEFLKHVANQEKAKVLKKKLLCIRKNLTATNQERELTLAKKEKIEDDIEKMKLSYERTVQLGRALLSRTQDPSKAGDLSPDHVLMQLNSMTIHTVHQQTRLQLAAAEKELARRRQEAADRRSLTDNQKRSLTLKVESNMQHVKETQYRIQQLKEEVVTLTTQIRQTEENKSELEARTQKMRRQISYCQKHLKQNNEMSEEEREKMKRRLQRILRRKDNYLERERILQRLKEELK
ncbi:uveal autoantigen with coiled-coil domains and ankyrin repeats protein-like [Hyla sarda]|uniref:uveal autoantigen with coiled-coil domains and ankyrin repeats protein-like n=1 Tax=Hyla sarda TaxID=327740 RepID=UPI0024C39F02|nr:uveal autoantigen with coiled-coil domains and ankyrin repeats protein-like [Hyla sarda]XP_056416826.1 uveal autoantigen with coiled-coil domains and ankyrin repeats protein-like [Hyla sarda]